MGTLVAGKFNLIVSFQYNLTDELRAQWRASWQRASELLYSASGGAHQFGNIYLAEDGFGGRNADWWIDPDNAQAHVDGNRIWSEGHGTLGWDEKDYPFIIVHEFGHYGYDCGDEYGGNGCTNEEVSCIMESEKNKGDRFEGGTFVQGVVTEWCVEENHDPNGDTSQHDYDYGGESGHSCRYAINYHYGVPIPDDIPDGTRTVGADAVNFIELKKQTRIVLVLDRSYSMLGLALQEALIGATSLIDLTDHDGQTYKDHLGVVTFSSSVSENLPLRLMEDEDDREAASNSLAGVVSSGSTSIGDALRAAITAIEGEEGQAAAQAIVLLTDGYHNHGAEAPLGLLDELRDKGIAVFSIGVGSDVDTELLEALAEGTGGRFARISPDLSEADAALQIRFELTEVHDLLHDQGGLVTRLQEELEAEAPHPQTEAEKQLLSRAVAAGIPTEAVAVVAPRWGAYSRLSTTHIEKGSHEATFFTSWRGKADTGDLLLRSPSGQIYSVRLGVLPPGGRRLGHGRPYLGVRVPDPEPGDWLSLVVATSPRHAARFAFSHSRGVALKVGTNTRSVDVGGRFELTGHLYYREPLAGVKWEAILIDPKGKSLRLEMKHPGSGRSEGCDSQPYQATTPSLRRPGFYTLLIQATTTDATTYAYRYNSGIERDGRDDPRPPIPRVTRLQRLTLRVGKEPVTRVRPMGDVVWVEPGSKGRVPVQVTGASAVNIVRVEGGSGIVATAGTQSGGIADLIVEAAPDAEPGPRHLVIVTRQGRHVLEGALNISTRQAQTCSDVAVKLVQGTIAALRTAKPGRVTVATICTPSGGLVEVQTTHPRLVEVLWDAADAARMVEVEIDRDGSIHQVRVPFC